ncbi:MAG: HEAT repeat domain-containing protein [Clostridium sp.]|uniref:HEAT repeat domain-containing protein n=1 Tax=Clostridium sp. TaxID=1506 RepID=UPI003036E389
MSTGLIKYDWNFIENYSDEEISYFLSLEGKSLDAISKIRNIDRAAVQKHIISCKIKYRFLVKSESPAELFKTLMVAVKSERIMVLNSIDRVNREKLIYFITKSYMDMGLKDKEAAIWIMGELRSNACVDILIKATVNNHVNIRRMSISALGKIGDVKAAIAVIRALEDKNPQVVSYAVKSLQKINTREADKKVQLLFENTDKEYIKKACEDYMRQAKNEDIKND